jgi:uncharacterized protein (TIGR02246 family)
MDELQTLLAESACRDVVLAAADAVDRNDPDGLAALFAPDGVLVRPDGTRLVGRDAVRAAYAARPADRLTQHLVCNHRLAVQADGTVRSVARVLLVTGRWSDAPTPRGRPMDAPPQVGVIEDRLERTPEGWRIAERQARFELHFGPPAG